MTAKVVGEHQGLTVFARQSTLSAEAFRLNRLGNLLATVGAQLALVAKGSERSAPSLDLVHANLLRMKRICDGPLAPWPGRRKTIAVPLLFERTVRRLHDLAGHSCVAIEAHCDDGQVMADVDAIDEALFNLLSNAIAASERDDTVYVRARTCDDGDLEWTIRDEGPGIPPERLRVLGQPLSAHQGGLGLGIAVAAAIVDSHDGLLHVSSSLEGTRVTVWLPGADRSSRACRGARRADETRARGR